jgi:hypothetical protein
VRQSFGAGTGFRTALRAGAAVATVAVVAAACGGRDAVPASSGPGPLRLANTVAEGFTYSLLDLSSCEVGDGLTIVSNTGTKAVRVLDLSLDSPAATASGDRSSFDVVAVKAGSTPGEAGTTFALTKLGGRSVGPAPTLLPEATSGLSYVLVDRIAVRGAHATRWSVNGIGVTYRSGTTTYVTVFPQLLELAAVHSCATHHLDSSSNAHGAA